MMKKLNHSKKSITYQQLKKISTAFLMLLLSACNNDEKITDGPNEERLLVDKSSALSKMAGFAGEFEIVDARSSSTVASTVEMKEKMPIGQVISFSGDKVYMEGASCDDWQIVPTKNEVVFIHEDPNLIDMTLGPADTPKSSGDQQQHKGFSVRCEGEIVFDLHKVDDRVLVVPIANSAINLILERKLTPLQIKTYQLRLKSVKYYHGELTGKLDDATLRASRYWYEDRARLGSDQPVPARPAITENLLDTFGVLSNP